MADSESSSYDGFLSYSHAADDLLAPRLQAGLQRFAKPWWKRRALRIFRDEASLSANPHLWSSITDALDDSDWFVLLLSPDAAQSEWVNREIDYWVEHKDAARILPVVTDGTFGWDGDVAGNAVPPPLQGVFTDEPRWVDLRFARTETQLDLRHARFRDAIADVAAAIRGVAKDELESEEIRQHRRTIRTTWTAGIAILALGIAAAVGAIVAFNAQQDAQDERDRAVAAEQNATQERDRAITAEAEATQERDRAITAEAEADSQRVFAEEQAEIAQANADLARSRELAASAINVLEESPELSVLLALEATAGTDPPFESVSALHEALQKHRAVRTVYRPAEWERSVGLFGLISPDGKYMAISGLRHQLGVWDLESGAAEPLWEFEVPYPDHAVVFPYFSIDGSQVVATVAWFNRDVSQLPEPSAETGIYLFDTLTGEIIRHIRGPRCPPIGLFQNGRFIDTDRPLGVATPSADDCSVDNLADLSLIDLTTGETTLAYDQPVFAWDYEPSASLSDDGRYLAFTHDNLSTVVDLDGGAQAIEKPGGWYAKLTGDGSRLLAAQERTVSLWDIDNGTEIWTIEAPLALNDVRFNDDDTYVIAGAHDGVVRVWDATSGEILHELHGLLSFSWIISMTHDHTLIASASANAMRVWDLSPNAEGEVAGFDIPGASLLQAGKMVDDRGAILRYPDALSELQQPGTAMVMNVASNEVEFQFPDTYGGHLVRLSPNERLLAGQPFVGPGLLGPIHIRDVASGEVLVELQDLCTFDVTVKALGSDCADRPTAKADQVSGIDFSPDGSMIAIGGADEGIVGVWEVETGQRLAWLDLPGLRGADHAVVQFSPSADLLMAATTEIHIYSTDDWSQVASFPIDWGIWDAQFTQDGRYLLAADATEGAIITIDTNTWNQVGPALVGHEGAARDIDVNSDGSIIASGGSDGKVLIWDRESGDLLQSIPVGSSATLVDFITDQHLLIIPEGRPALVMTIDVPELIDIARSRITRGFTADECATYRIDPCPSLAAIRGGD